MTHGGAGDVERLWRECHVDLRRWFRHRGRPHDADDLVQEVFVVLCRRAGTLDGPPCRGWLFGVARHVLAHDRRHHARHPQMLRAEPPAFDISYRDGASDVVIRLWVENVLRKLPGENGDLLRQAYLLDRPLDALAESAGCSVGAMRVRLHRARRLAAAPFGDDVRPAITEGSCNGTERDGHVPREAPQPLTSVTSQESS